MATEQFSPESRVCGWSGAEDLLVPAPVARRQAHLAPELVSMLEGEMVPRLMLMRQPAATAEAQAAPAPFTTDDVEELVRLLLAHDSAVACAYIDVLRRDGVTTHQVCLNLLAPAARLLGRLWEEDRCGFADVTMGVCRLHQVLHRLTADELQPFSEDQEGHSNLSLLASLPGEQHTFGLLILARFLRRERWDVWTDFPADKDQLLETAGEKPFKIIGLSIGRDSRLRELAVLIKALRRASKNRSVAVMVGGPIVALRPEIGRQVGADAAPVDAQEAARWAQRYWK